MTAVSNQTPADVASDYATIQFIITQLLSRTATATLVRVVACTRSGGVSAWGTVDVQPLISQLAGSGEVVPHKNLFRLPYSRLQGGTNAVIIDPEPGDIGIVVFASRDISALKKQPAIDSVKGGEPGVPPGSLRQYDMSDGLYVGGVLNGVPTQRVRFFDGGIEVLSPTKVVVSAPEIELTASTSVTVEAPTITLDGDVHITGETIGDDDGTFDGISVATHDHGGVTTGGGNTGPPNP